MSKKHVEEYYLKMVSDYTEMKNVLEELKKCESNAENIANNIDNIKEQVRLLEANYKRLSYIMFLLNQPNKDNKKKSYIRREGFRVKNIENEHTQDGVEKENTKVLNNLNDYI